MNRAGPPEEWAGGTLEACRPGKTENAAARIIDFPIRCNTRLVEVRRCLTEDWWLWLEWTAACNTGGWLP